MTMELTKELWQDKGGLALEFAGIRVSTFTYKSKAKAPKENGAEAKEPEEKETEVHAIRFANNLGDIVMLPFQGQQIWSGKFYRQSLGMDSLVKEPKLGKDYLPGYGAVLVHCGPRRIGCPVGDEHELHGVLPNADYIADLILNGGESTRPFVALHGVLSDDRRIGEDYYYDVQPTVFFYNDSSVMGVCLEVTNRSVNPMDLMVLEHYNLAFVPGAEMINTAPCTPENFIVRKSLPDHAKGDSAEAAVVRERLEQLIADAQADPAKYAILSKNPIYDPELVMAIYGFKADDEGWAHSMAVDPKTGFGRYVAHRPDEFDRAHRWIRIVTEQDPGFPVMSAMGMSLPANAGVEGYGVESQKEGGVPQLDGKAPDRSEASAYFHTKVGILNPQQVEAMREKIERIMK